MDDYYDRYEDSYDPEFEDFAQETGFLTNFPERQLPQYQAAVEAYKLINPDVGFVISSGWHCEQALYVVSGRQDLGEFWRLFETFKGA